MSEGEKKVNGEIYRNIPRRIPCLPRDLLQRFMSKNQFMSQTQNLSDGNSNGEVEIELDLGLSLNGRFGVDPLAKTRLTRSSSIPDFMVNNSVRLSSELEKEGSCVGYVGPSEGLKRACSLPTETEEEWRKRKEMQSLRRLEAKRKRSEKQRNVRVLREKHKAGEDKVVEDRREEGSIGSSGSGSSGLSELDTLPPSVQATNKSLETSPTSAQSVPEKPPCNSTENPTSTRVKEAIQNILEDMPCVSTTGNGPNGKKIDGFLYRYKKGEEVRIVCVCHGSFLSPAEFVKHAGGGDVAHPLKHIVVNPTPFL